MIADSDRPWWRIDRARSEVAITTSDRRLRFRRIFEAIVCAILCSVRRAMRASRMDPSRLILSRDEGEEERGRGE